MNKDEREIEDEIIKLQNDEERVRNDTCILLHALTRTGLMQSFAEMEEKHIGFKDMSHG